MILLRIFTSKEMLWILHSNNYYKYHNSNGASIILESGSKLWYINGTRHRLDGPACEFSNGYKEWYINGVQYASELVYWITVQRYEIN